MKRVKRIEEKPSSTIEYINFYKKNRGLFKGGKNTDASREIKIAFLSSFTANGLKEVLSVKCHQLSLLPEIFIGGYNQYSQEIFNDKSGLYKLKPELIILFIDIRTIAGEFFLLPYAQTGKQRQAWVEQKRKEVGVLIKKLKEKSLAKIALHNFEVPYKSPLKILEIKEDFSWREAVETLNGKIREDFKGDNQVFVFDYNNFVSTIGKQKIFDHKLYYLGDIKFNWEYLPELCEEYLGYVKPLKQLTKKCLVLDLDNTLWGGIVGEDGFNGIKLGPTPEGRPFWEFQKYILSLYQRGVILAINSKNNLVDAIEIFRKHPYSILKEEHFASIKINWEDKIINMKKIAEEINIGLDSLVFIDDDKSNRAMVSAALPEVFVVEMSEDPASYLETLEKINDFNVLKIIEEDRKKGKMYSAERKRVEFQKSVSDIKEYLEGLKIKIKIKKADKFTLPRIAQLINKTNQFNTTSIRYSEEVIRKMADDKNYLVLSLTVEDKFGDSGLAGVAIIDKRDKKIWKITSFLLSCRIIGKQIEDAFLAFIIKNAKKNKAGVAIGEFIKTAKNEPAGDFYKKNGFELISNKNGKEIWEYKTNKIFYSPNFIKTIKK
jgi:FkbH-like protein